MNLTPTQRRFHLQRFEDISGVSGVGDRIAEGCVFSNGACVIEWLSACASTNRYGNLEAMLQVHGHNGATVVVWDDPDPRAAHRKAVRTTLEEDLGVVVNAFKATTVTKACKKPSKKSRR